MRDQNLFQGNINKKNYFEGWYYKQVSENGKNTISFIFGVSTDCKNPHAFIQIISNIVNKSHYLSYPLSAFLITDIPFCIQIENNYFYRDKIVLDINKKEIQIQGTLSFSHLIPLTTSLYRPTIMGPFSYFKGMECNHGIVSLYHVIEGYLYYNKKKIDFTKGIGYIEKDYGTSFPKEYTWISSTHGTISPASFLLSIAYIPFARTSFKGILCVLLYKGKQYFFTTYYGCYQKKYIKGNHFINIILKQNYYKLYIDVQYEENKILYAPMKGQMKKKIKESLDANIHILLYKHKKIIVDEVFSHGGLEIV